MAKTKSDRKVNRIAKMVNKKLKEDVFEDRFWVRQVKKMRDSNGTQYYLYEMKDRLEPNRDSFIPSGWIREGNPFIMSDFFEAVNDFIVRSSFWSKYNSSMYDEASDVYADKFYHLHSK